MQGARQEVYTPTLTGLGERVDLASPQVDLETHVLDVLGESEYEDLRDAVLVGYSYRGLAAAPEAPRPGAGRRL